MRTWPAGSFQGLMPLTRWKGPLDYIYDPDPNPIFRFQFTRSTGQVVLPSGIDTDGGSIPRFLWILPDLDPWTYFPAYLLHDYLYLEHHAGRGLSFEDTNDILAEAITTLTQLKLSPGGDFQVNEIYDGVSSVFGRVAWDKSVAALGGMDIMAVILKHYPYKAYIDCKRIAERFLQWWTTATR